MKFILPKPPSTNTLYINIGRGRAKSQRYKSWIEWAGLSLNAQASKQITGPVAITIKLNKGTGDLANYEKAIVDLLVRHKCIEDDCNVVDLHMIHVAQHPPKEATITVLKAEIQRLA